MRARARTPAALLLRAFGHGSNPPPSGVRCRGAAAKRVLAVLTVKHRDSGEAVSMAEIRARASDEYAEAMAMAGRLKHQEQLKVVEKEALERRLQLLRTYESTAREERKMDGPRRA